MPITAMMLKINKIKNKTNKPFEIEAAAPWTPLKPKAPATIAINKKINAQYNNISTP